MKPVATVLIMAAALLTGCAANVAKPSPQSAAVRVPADSAAKIVFNISGPKAVMESKDWEPFKTAWQNAMKAKTREAGIAFDMQEGAGKPTGEAGTLLSLQVNDYRYLSTGARVGFGIFGGNAYIDARARFADLKTGRPFGEQSYNTSSSAWEGIFSAMTDKQIDAIASEIVRDVKAR